MKSKSDVMKDLSKVLNKKIVIEKYTTVTTPNGFDKEEWLYHKSVWASINNLFGKEFYAAKAVQSEMTVEFTIRYSKDLEVLLEKDSTKLYRISWNKKSFNITFVDNIKYQNEWIKIKAEVS